MLHWWRIILSKLDIVWQSYENVHKGLLFYHTWCGKNLHGYTVVTMEVAELLTTASAEL